LWVAFRFIHRLGRHDEILGDERCAPHDGNVSARESAGGIRSDDEQQGSVPGGPHHRKLRPATIDGIAIAGAPAYADSATGEVALSTREASEYKPYLVPSQLDSAQGWIVTPHVRHV